MDETKPGQSLPLGQPLNAAPTPTARPAPVSEPSSLDEKLDAWLDDHPEGKGFEEKAPVATAEPEAPPVEEPPSEVAPGDADVPGTTPAPPSEAPAATPPPTDEPQAKAPAPVEKPPVPESVPFSLDAKYVFSEGAPAWTGQQVVDALRERAQALPLAQEAAVFHEVFGMPAAQAKELWEPNLAWMRQNPRQLEMIASLIQDQQKASYILNCADYYDTPEARSARGEIEGPQLQMSADVEKRFKQLETENKRLLDAENERRKAHYTNRITRELNTAFERYPYLRDNPQMVQALLARAYWINGGDDSENSKGVLDALDMERELYDAKLTALNSATAIAHDAAAPPPVPPLMGSAGASPQATQPRVAPNRKFGSLDDAVDDWFANPPAQFR